MTDETLESATIPDTLFLRDHASDALNALTRYVDADDDYRPYMTARLTEDPAVLEHSGWDWGSSVGRLVSSIVLAREMTGEDIGEDIERRLRSKLLEMFDEDGLNYREEAETNAARANMHDQRSVLLGLTTWYLATGDEEAAAAADDLCAALRRIAVKSGHPHLARQDFWYFPAVEYTRDGWPSEDTIYLGLATDPAHTSARMINPLVRYYELTGNEDALELAENFARHTVEYSGAFDDDGSFNDGVEFRTGHFHSRMVSVTAIARLARNTGNAAYLNWTERVYDWALSQGTEFGWFPAALREDYDRKHETCALVDMIELGITLAESGYEEYWGTVERFVRNHLVESQLRETDWIAEADDPVDDAHRAVGDRSRGAFPGWAAPNDFVCDLGDDPDVMTCCICSGTRGLFLAWDAAVTEERDTVSVNFLFNRVADPVDVESYLPHEGRVDVTARRNARKLRIRIPSWAPTAEVRIARGDGASAKPEDWEGQFVVVRDVAEDDRVSVTFPVRERTTVERVGDSEYRAEWRGDDVLSISPSGTHAPMYADRERLEEVPSRTVTCRRGAPDVHW